MEPKNLVRLIVNAAGDIKAEDIVVFQLSELTSFADYFVVCTGNSDRQVKAIAESISKKCKSEQIYPLGVEGAEKGQWILIDYGSVVAHVFHPEAREYYGLEKMWIDAPRVSVS